MATIEATKEIVGAEIVNLGHLANHEDHELGMWAACKAHKGAVFWSAVMVWTSLLAGYDQNAPAFYLSIPQFRKDFGEPYEGDYVIPANWQAAFNASSVATSIIGALGAAYISDRIGRKYTLIGAMVITYAAVTLEMVATTKAMYFGGEFLNGFSVGTLATVCLTYVDEVTPLSLRGLMNCIVGTSYTVAPFLTSLVLYGVGDWNTRWAYRALICSQYGFAIVTTVLIPFMPESPSWLVSRGKTEKALKSLNRLGYKNGEEEKRLAYITLVLERIRAETEGVTYLECFKKSNLRRTIISIAPLSMETLSGVTFLATYFAYWLELIGYSVHETFLLNLIYNLLTPIGSIMSFFLIDRWGRRNMIFYGVLVIFIQLCLVGGLGSDTSNKPALKTAIGILLIWSWWYGVTIQSSAYALLGEVATSRLRAKTVAIGLSLNSLFSLIFSFVIPYMFNPNEGNLGSKTAFIFAGMTVFCLVYLYFYVPETAGRSYEELDEMFTNHVPTWQFKHYKTEAQRAGEQVKAKYAGEGEAAVELRELEIRSG